jgi:hypothetical protein
MVFENSVKNSMLFVRMSGMFCFVKRHLAKSVCLFALFALSVPALAIAAEDEQAEGHPFKHIVERNVFALKPPPPPADPNDVPPPPPPTLAKVILTGILNVLGPPRALLEVTETEAGKQTTPRKPILREGERDGSIEVLSIDVDKNLVRIKNGSFETNLTFAAVQQSGAPGAPGAPPPLPTLQPPPGAAAASAPDGDMGRRGVTVSGAPQNTPANPPPIGASQGVIAMPSRQIRTSQSQATTTDPVAQWVQMKAQAEAARQGRDPSVRAGTPMPPVPPLPGVEDPDQTAPPPNPGFRSPRPTPPLPPFPVPQQ